MDAAAIVTVRRSDYPDVTYWVSAPTARRVVEIIESDPESDRIATGN
jgi:hypothetical protein